jgi:uncharacterized lipoprotein YddW (UPF0748 family)
MTLRSRFPPVRPSAPFGPAVLLLWLLLALPGLAAAAVELRPTPLDEAAPFRRFLWVTRWDYRTAEDIERICYNAASARFTDLLFQVRGEGTVFFRSPHEPWAWELSGKGSPAGVGVDPGWDPLAVAVREGRRRGLRVHAYLNVMPAWAQKTSPPRSSGQIYAARPEWLMVDSKGRRIEPRGFYACVDPGLPEVRDYLARLMGRLAADYPVDGVHLDYIRYPFETGDYSFHPKVVAAYRAQTGKAARADDPDWIQFRQDQVTATVRDINNAVKSARPGTEVSAAVIARMDVSRNKAGQDSLGWLARNEIDAVAPMVYVHDYSSFNEIAAAYTNGPERSKVWLGIWAIEKNQVMLDQIRNGAARDVSGIAVFSYESLFKGHRTSPRAVDVYRTFVNARSGGVPLEYNPPAQMQPRPSTPAQTAPARTVPARPAEPSSAKRAEPAMKVRVES